MTTSRRVAVARCGRPTQLSDDDLMFSALERMEAEIAELRARCERLRASKLCPQCSDEVDTCPPLARARLFRAVDRFSGWMRAFWP